MRSKITLIYLGIFTLVLGACASGGPMGGTATTGGAAEEHCQKYGKSAVPTSIGEGGTAFKCVGSNERQPERR